jgi:hypothetical protein
MQNRQRVLPGRPWPSLGGPHDNLALSTTRGTDPLDTRTGQAICTATARHPAPCPIHPGDDTVKSSYKFNVVQQNIRALDPDAKTRRWMLGQPQMCWKCQKDKPLFGGTIKMFGSVRRFICVDCVLAKQVELARAKGELT